MAYYKYFGDIEEDNKDGQTTYIFSLLDKIEITVSS